MKKIFILVISIIIGILVYKKNDEVIIPSDAIRIRIIANSNSIKDLYEKKVLKESIKDDIYNLIGKATSSSEVDRIIMSNIPSIKKTIASKMDSFEISYGLNYFPSKTYKGVIYPEGSYKSLVITLGSGLGENWWCVLYPPLCLIDDNRNTSDVEYRLLVANILKN